jgi:hypothetical protein
MVIGKNKKIRAIISGLQEDFESKLIESISKLLKE